MCLLSAPVWMWNRCITWQSITLAAGSLCAKEFFTVWCLKGVQHFALCLMDYSTTQTMQPCSVTEDTEKSEMLFLHTELTDYSSYIYRKVLGVQDGYKLWPERVQRPGKYVKELADPDPENLTMLAWSFSEEGLGSPHSLQSWRAINQVYSPVLVP